jgi:hypothetical protein
MRVSLAAGTPEQLERWMPEIANGPTKRASVAGWIRTRTGLRVGRLLAGSTFGPEFRGFVSCDALPAGQANTRNVDFGFDVFTGSPGG